MRAETGHSYIQSIKAMILVGGSQVVGILLGIVRVKIMAILLGPSGVGLVGVFNALIAMVSSFAGMGIASSGVRQIAEAVGGGDEQKFAQSRHILIRLSFILGGGSVIFMAVFSMPISWITFGNHDRSLEIAILATALFFTVVAAGYTGLVQGVRRVRDLAAMGVFGAFWGTLFTIPLVYFFREKGIVPSLIVVSAMSAITAWWYARKIPAPAVVRQPDVDRQLTRNLLSLGVVFMSSALMMNGVMYLIRLLINRQIGIEGVGLYQAAYALSGLYVGVILNAMGMDFYPRLTSRAQDNPTCNRLVNEQTEVGLYLAVPGVLATLAFAPLVLKIFYSTQFLPAVEVLRWQAMGIFLRVISWPLGFVLMAKGKGKFFFGTELAANVVHVALIWFGVSVFGLAGTGMAFFGLYVFYTILMAVVIRKMTGFSWSYTNRRLMVIGGFSLSAVFVVRYLVPQVWAQVFNVLLTAIVCLYCAKAAAALVGVDSFSGLIKKIRTRFIGTAA